MEFARVVGQTVPDEPDFEKRPNCRRFTYGSPPIASSQSQLTLSRLAVTIKAYFHEVSYDSDERN